MTALGKILVFLVLVLSLAFNALVVNAYVARTNWKAEADKSQKRAKDAADSANGMKALLDETVAANEDAKRVLREEKDRLYNQVAVLQAEVNRLDDANKQQLAAAARLNTQIDVLQANIARLTKQVDDYDKLIAAKELQINQLTGAANASKVSENKAILERDAEKQRAENFAQIIQDLRDQLAAKQGLKPNSLPGNFRGTVESYDRASGLITMTPGLDAGVQKGAKMSVYRLVGGGKFLGTIEVLQADPKKAVGRFGLANPRNLNPPADDFPRAGDELKPYEQ